MNNLEIAVEESEFCYGSTVVAEEDLFSYRLLAGGWRTVLQCQNNHCHSHRFHISPRRTKSKGYEGEIYLEGWGDSREEAEAELWCRISSEGLIPPYGIELEETSR